MGFWQEGKQELGGKEAEVELDTFLLSVSQLSFIPAAAKNFCVTIAIIQKPVKYRST